MTDLNFFAPYHGEKQKVVNKKIYIYTTAAILTLGILGSLTYNTVNIYLTEKAIEEFNTKINSAEVQEKVKEANEVNKKISVLQKYDKGIDGINSDINRKNLISSYFLNKINSKTPKDISMTSITAEDGKLNFVGTSKSRQDVGDFENGLKNIEFIDDVQVSTINEDLEKQGNFTFNIKCTLKDVENNEDK